MRGISSNTSLRVDIVIQKNIINSNGNLMMKNESIIVCEGKLPKVTASEHDLDEAIKQSSG